MLFTPDGKQITRVPHTADFTKAVRLLGDRRAEAVRHEVHRIIDEMAPDTETGRRTFSSSQVGSALKPWPYPLAGLYDIALEIEGNDTTGRQVYDRAGFMLGLFVWECLMARKERWVLYDHDVNQTDPHRAITDTVYVEQGEDETITKHQQRKRG